MSYFDLYLSMIETYNKEGFKEIGSYPTEEIFELFGCSKLSFYDEMKFLKLLNSICEDGFNSGFKFAMRIFLNNL